MNLVEPIRDLDDIQAMKDYLKFESAINEDRRIRNYMIFMTGINSGLRIGDIVKLKVKDVQGWHIRVKEQKTGKIRTFRMPKPLKSAMREYVKDRPHHHYIFQSREGKNKPLTTNQCWNIIKEAAEFLGLENIGTHSMRKTFGYHYYKKFGDVTELMVIFNHASPTITLRYIGITQDRLDNQMRKFSL
ncbi:site-specific integrase [Streptococcus cameli]